MDVNAWIDTEELTDEHRFRIYVVTCILYVDGRREDIRMSPNFYLKYSLTYIPWHLPACFWSICHFY